MDDINGNGEFDTYNGVYDSDLNEIFSDDNGNGVYDEGEDFVDVSEEFLDFDDPDYGIYNSDGEKEKVLEMIEVFQLNLKK